MLLCAAEGRAVTIMALSRVASKLYESVRKGDESDYTWFEDALVSSMNSGMGLDQVIWNAVREIIDQVSREEDRRELSHSMPI